MKFFETSSACGKIILSGEYAVVFDFPGIAVPTKERITVANSSQRSASSSTLKIQWMGEHGGEQWDTYIRSIVALIEKEREPARGTITIDNHIPLRKGMGSSTALVIALCRCLLGNDCRDEALKIEDEVNPGHSGLDFAVIWEEKPILFKKGSTLKAINLPTNLLIDSRLIDTGTPNESTPELVAWIRSRYESKDPSVCNAIETIGNCTQRIVAGESLKTVMRDHHRAQIVLGVVTPEAQRIIAEIEKKGGAGKVLGAGARTGGGGMILVI